MNRSRDAPESYEILTVVHYRELSWEPGQVVTFPKGVNVKWLLSRGAIRAAGPGKEVSRVDA